MEYIFGAVIVLVGALFWWLHGLTNSRVQKAEKEAEAIHDAQVKRRKADDAIRSSDRIKRVRERFNNE